MGSKVAYSMGDSWGKSCLWFAPRTRAFGAEPPLFRSEFFKPSIRNFLWGPPEYPTFGQFRVTCAPKVWQMKDGGSPTISGQGKHLGLDRFLLTAKRPGDKN